ncbi:hypothetical protein A4X06_0g5806 [Tilletia controversa]|uniref:Uncharacterized protein n=2 Tax=Tilletia TaxID=13289 RepID=A0A8X7SVI7_9BASI|nr:hypothetical protein CF328_g4939 [Tilletia controversa]KAE8197196.1 hypothetical protein CF335_g4678 [Tilletia laevis]KAE8245145.1 hypothetical protein A4X06_0g5806 [Tilletia controversa]KAE8257390.1 hypothetical protein A4X03_0g4681 [Tilletia caries]
MLQPRFLLFLPLLLLLLAIVANSVPVTDLTGPSYAALPQASANLVFRNTPGTPPIASQELLDTFRARYGVVRDLADRAREGGFNLEEREALLHFLEAADARAVGALEAINRERVRAGLTAFSLQDLTTHLRLP